jgi:hypothetical protein
MRCWQRFFSACAAFAVVALGDATVPSAPPWAREPSAFAAAYVPSAAPVVPASAAVDDAVDVPFIPFEASNARRDPRWGPALVDLASHLPASYGTEFDDHDLVTHAHETTHAIAGHLRSTLAPEWQANALYAMRGRAVVLAEPRFRKADVAPFVPPSLRASRFDTYLVEQTEWDDTPLYVFDEWVAYTNGGAVGIDLVERGLWPGGWRDAIDGPLEFTVYALALGMAAEVHDPDYAAREPAFACFLRFSVARAMRVVCAGAAMPPFRHAWIGAYLEALRTNPDAAPLREYARRTLGPREAADALGLGRVDGACGDDARAP